MSWSVCENIQIHKVWCTGSWLFVMSCTKKRVFIHKYWEDQNHTLPGSSTLTECLFLSNSFRIFSSSRFSLDLGRRKFLRTGTSKLSSESLRSSMSSRIPWSMSSSCFSWCRIVKLVLKIGSLLGSNLRKIKKL